MGEDVVITYETLFEHLRREKNRGELQEVDQQFYQNVIAYIHQKRQLIEQQPADDSLFGDDERREAEKQLANVRKIVREIYEVREKKIIDMALNKSRTQAAAADEDALLPEEKPFFEDVCRTLDKGRQDVLYNVLKAETPPAAEHQEKEGVKVRFLYRTDKFAGPDMTMYGPYEKDAVDTFPETIVEMLKTRGAVEVLDDQSGESGQEA